MPYLQYAFDVYVAKDDEMSKDVMHRIWEVLQATHRVITTIKNTLFLLMSWRDHQRMQGHF